MKQPLSILFLIVGLVWSGWSAPTSVSTNQFYLTNGVAVIYPSLLVTTNTPVRNGTNVFTGVNQFTNSNNQFKGTFYGTGTLTNSTTLLSPEVDHVIIGNTAGGPALLTYSVSYDMLVADKGIRSGGGFHGSGAGLTNLLTAGISDLFTSNARLIELTVTEAYQMTTIAYDGDGVVTTATVLWPDGSGGTFTTVTKNATFLTIDAFTVTHTVSGKTITQPLVYRNGSGYVTNKPALTITP